MSQPIDELRVSLEELLAWIRPAWHADAACREHPEISFFPARGESLAPARSICASCLVTTECRTAGIDGHETGIWGGLADRNRRALRPHREPHQTAA